MPRGPASRAVAFSCATTWAGVNAGYLFRTSAATPATIGAENDVPLARPYGKSGASARGTVLAMSKPGAARSTQSPYELNPVSFAALQANGRQPFRAWWQLGCGMSARATERMDMSTTRHGATEPSAERRRGSRLPVALLAVGVVVCLAAALLVGGGAHVRRTGDESVTAAPVVSGSPAVAADATTTPTRARVTSPAPSTRRTPTPSAASKPPVASRSTPANSPRT